MGCVSPNCSRTLPSSPGAKNWLAMQPPWGQSRQGLEEAGLVPRACGFTRSFWKGTADAASMKSHICGPEPSQAPGADLAFLAEGLAVRYAEVGFSPNASSCYYTVKWGLFRK